VLKLTWGQQHGPGAISTLPGGVMPGGVAKMLLQMYRLPADELQVQLPPLPAESPLQLPADG
jgi:hypothetical protein